MVFCITVLLMSIRALIDAKAIFRRNVTLYCLNSICETLNLTRCLLRWPERVLICAESFAPAWFANPPSSRCMYTSSKSHVTFEKFELVGRPKGHREPATRRIWSPRFCECHSDCWAFCNVTTPMGSIICGIGCQSAKHLIALRIPRVASRHFTWEACKKKGLKYYGREVWCTVLTTGGTLTLPPSPRCDLIGLSGPIGRSQRRLAVCYMLWARID